MELKYTTTSRLNHTTNIKPEAKPVDGGRQWITEAFDFIRREQQVGELTVQFGPGGTITDMKFRESVAVSQKELDFVVN
jgi:hypothetical protein